MFSFQKYLLILATIITLIPSKVDAAGYSISIDTTPQTVDIRGTMLVTLKILKGTSPVPNTQIFLGLQGITGELKNQMVVTDKSGLATTEFKPQDPGFGYILAKATINNSGNIESLEAMAQIAVKDLNVEPTSIVDQVYPLPGRIGQTIMFIGHGIDPDGKVIKWLWSMGDGKTYEGEGENSKISHVYEKTGTYYVNFYVTDNRNVTSKPVVSKIVVIDNKLPYGSMSGVWPQKANINQELVFETKITDPEGRLSGCRIDFGDGNNQSIQTTGIEAICFFKHRYKRPGTYTVFATPIDDQGNGDPFPNPAWQVVVEGEAKGGAKLTIIGAIGKTINLLGPLPSHKIAFEATLGTDTVETGMLLSEGQYKLVAANRSFGFDLTDTTINITPYTNTEINTSIWVPTIKLETALNRGIKKLNISILNQSGQPIQIKAFVEVTTTDGSVYGAIQTSTGFASLAIPKNLTTINPSIKVDFDYVTTSTQKTLQYPPSLPDIRLKPVSSSDNPEILITSNILVTGQMNLSWKLWDRLSGIEIPVNRLIGSAPKEIYVSLIPYRLPVKVDKADPGRYLLTVDCQMNIFGTTVTDSCQFDPCARKLDIVPGWGISPSGKVILRASVFDIDSKPVCGQRLKIGYEIGRAIGFVPDKNILTTLPSVTRTNCFGTAWLEIDLTSALGNIDIEDVKVTFSTITSGLTHMTTISIPPPPKEFPILEGWTSSSDSTIEVKIKLSDKTKQPLKGKWVDIFYSVGNLNLSQKELGYPPVSIRTNQEGVATFTIAKPQNISLEIVFLANIDGMTVTNILTVPKQ